MINQLTPFSEIADQGGVGDVIFVHGLSGDPVETWSVPLANEVEGAYWPRWLAADVKHLNYYTIGYPASVFAQWAKKEMNLYQRAKQLLETLAGYGIGDRPTIFICHSLGGLLLKKILRTSYESGDSDWRKISENCKGVIFIATPHTGSSLATLLKFFSVGFSSSHVSKLTADTAELDEMNESFRQFSHAKVCQWLPTMRCIKRRRLLWLSRLKVPILESAVVSRLQ